MTGYRKALHQMIMALSKANFGVWRRSPVQRYLGYVQFEEYGRLLWWRAWFGRRVRTREPAVFLVRWTGGQSLQGGARACVLFGRTAQGLRARATRRTPKAYWGP